MIRNLFCCLLISSAVFLSVSTPLAAANDLLSRDVLLKERQQLQAKMISPESTVFPEVLPESIPDNIPVPELPVESIKIRARLLLLNYLLSDIDQDTYVAAFDSLEEEYGRELAGVAVWLDQQLKDHFPVDLERLDFMYKAYFIPGRNWWTGEDLFISMQQQHTDIISRQRQKVIAIIDQVKPSPPVDAEYGLHNAVDTFLQQFQRQIPAPEYLPPHLLKAITKSSTSNTNTFFQRVFCQVQEAAVDPQAASAGRLAYESRALLALPLDCDPADALALYYGFNARSGSSGVNCSSVQSTDYDFMVADSLLAGNQYADGLAVLQLLVLYRDVFTLLYDGNSQSFFGVNNIKSYRRAGDKEYAVLLEAVNDALFRYATLILELPDESVAPFIKPAIKFDIMPSLNGITTADHQEGN